MKSRFTEEQIIGILKEAESGRQVKDVIREHGISQDTLYRWRRERFARCRCRIHLLLLEQLQRVRAPRGQRPGWERWYWAIRYWCVTLAIR